MTSLACSLVTVGQSCRKSSIRSPAPKCSIRMRTATLVPANTGVPPNTSGFSVDELLGHGELLSGRLDAAISNALIRRAVAAKC